MNAKKQKEQQYQREYYLRNKERIAKRKKERLEKNINGYRDRANLASFLFALQKKKKKNTVIHDGKEEALVPMNSVNGIRSEFTRCMWQKEGIIPKPIYTKKYSNSQANLVKHVFRLVDEWYLPFCNAKEILHTFWEKTYNEKEIDEYVKSKGWKPWDGN